ncbi:hypothetical protein CEP52_004871 [Fusarium oligoseptatum]|uniref:Protein kinase domain-containing protein n=1 Tax=Fusarium oligoseptatum TaxID=2604345 RepID=A0A428U1K6_9HYPO|nr:hypothetical protein CEP52_004871 [Fusarium oligoseptatum]
MPNNYVSSVFTTIWPNKNARFGARSQALEQMLLLWAKHSGVDARKGMSLDDRLKDHPDLKATFIGLLELIEQKMTQALSSPDEHGDAETASPTMPRTDENVDPEEFLIKQKWRSYKGNTWETVGAAVDMLIELTAMIRKSTVRNSGLPTHFHRPDDYFAGYAKLLARNWFKDARRSLTDQLGDSVFHEEKISYPGAHPIPVPAEPKAAPLAIPRVERLKQTTPRIEFSTPTTPIIADLAPSSTNLSQVNRVKLEQRRRKVTALSGVTEGSVSIEETGFSYMYPEPPTLGEMRRYGVCPYCSGFLSASKLTKEAWRKHLHEDLQPYVCISEKCRDPAQFFTNSEQWLQHMDKFHSRDWTQKVHMRTWYCDREHERLEFKRESELQKHLSHDHGSLSEAHVSALVRRNWGVGCREAHVCPLCESTPNNIVPLMNDKDKATILFRHIGDHLKSLALFSLPSLNTGPASNGQDPSSGAQIPTNDDTKSDSTGKGQGVGQADEDLVGRLTFNDDPHTLMDSIGSEATEKGLASDVPSDVNAALEWEFVSSEQRGPEVDPVLEDLRVRHEQSQLATITPRRRATLLEQLLGTAAESVFDHIPQHFYPNGITDSLITKEAIISELPIESTSQAQHQEELEELVDFISLSAKKLFAITILTKISRELLQQRIRAFWIRRITDRDLPLLESKFRWEGRHTITFNPQVLEYNFEPETILPFTEKGSETGHDEFMDVTKFRIHENHVKKQAMDPSGPYYVGVKKSDRNLQLAAAPYSHQANILSRMNELNHKHIVYFLAAFRRGWGSEGLTGDRHCFSDIWSMGCIMLEFLIWLMYGVVDLIVQEWMDHMAADPVCKARTTALGELLDLISTRLLVTELPQAAELTATTIFSPVNQVHRCTPGQLEWSMRSILDEDKNESYWLPGEPNPPPGTGDIDLDSADSDIYPFPMDID